MRNQKTKTKSNTKKTKATTKKAKTNTEPKTTTKPKAKTTTKSQKANTLSAAVPQTTTVDIRKKAVDTALAVAGISAEPNTAGEKAYLDLIAAGEDPTMRASLVNVSGCGLVVSGIWRRIGVRAKEIEPPYKIGSAISRLFKVAEKAGAICEFKPGKRPEPGDVVLVGSTSAVQHVYTVIAAHLDSIGILSVDGGQRSASNAQAIRLKRRVWKDGIDRVEGATDPGGQKGRQVLRWIDITKLPMTTDVADPEEPLPDSEEPLPDSEKPLPEPPAETRSWPSILPRQKRTEPEEDIKVIDGKLNVPAAKLPPPPLSEKQKAIVKVIKGFRAALPDKIGTRSQARQGGYMYPGKTPAGFRLKERIDTIVWNELSKEGGASSINTYDNQILTWGFGFGGAQGGLPSVMEKLFALCPAAKDLLLDAGIGLEWMNGKAVWMVVNTATGAIELGKNALQMMKVDKQLLSVFITLGEDDRFALSSVEAQWKQIQGTSGKVPDYAKSWSDASIALGCHLVHWLPAYAWGMNDYSAAKGDLLKLVSLFGKIMGEKTGGAKPNGAVIAEKYDPVGHLKVFAGGAGLNAIKAVCAEPNEIDHPESDVAFANKLLFRVVSSGEKTNRYYVVPLPS